MKTKRFALSLIAISLLLALSACGDPDAPGPGSAPEGPGVDPAGTRQCVAPGWDGEGSPPPPEMYEGCEDPLTDGPEEPVSSGVDAGPADEVPNPGPSPVQPQPGQENVRAIGWEKVKPSADGTRADVIFWSGVEPCYVLDRVEVDYEASKVIITLFQGSTPMEQEVACIDIALKKVTTVELDEPLAGRKIVDGAPK